MLHCFVWNEGWEQFDNIKSIYRFTNAYFYQNTEMILVLRDNIEIEEVEDRKTIHKYVHTGDDRGDRGATERGKKEKE